MKLTISDPILVHAPEMNEAISHWGVYAIPRMWREPTGELVVRFNGEEDSSDFDNLNKAPNLYYISHDEGETWELCENGEELYSISVLTGIDPPYRKLKGGDTVYVKSVWGLPLITDTPYRKEFFQPTRRRSFTPTDSVIFPKNVGACCSAEYGARTAPARNLRPI